ncbi:MAG: isopentenyl-diphosphate Delta-isomerase [Armatimonadota bacterium]
MSTISVIIPTLNEETNIGLLLEALTRQGHPADEIIVVDGGSSDDTERVVSRFVGVKFVVGNPPVGAQRQLGLMAASGEWVVFLDADTMPGPDFLERVLSEMQLRRLDAACPWYSPYPSNPLITAVYRFFNLIFVALQKLAPSGAGSCIIARRDFAIRIGGFRSDIVYEDIEFIRRAGRRGRFGMLRQRIKVSDRRFREFGTMRVFLKYLALSLFFAFGMFKEAGLIDYPFGRYTRRDEEMVVLVDENDNPIGTAPKSSVHSSDTPSHRGFSLFVFNHRGELLLQERSPAKLTWPGQWSNSCCGHPGPGEHVKDAARRRAAYELGIDLDELHEIIPDYRYRAHMNGVVENEICPVLVGFTSQEPRPNAREVSATTWVKWDSFLERARSGESFTPWCIEEAEQLEKAPKFRQLMRHVCKL